MPNKQPQAGLGVRPFQAPAAILSGWPAPGSPAPSCPPHSVPHCARTQAPTSPVQKASPGPHLQILPAFQLPPPCPPALQTAVSLGSWGSGHPHSHPPAHRLIPAPTPGGPSRPFSPDTSSCPLGREGIHPSGSNHPASLHLSPACASPGGTQPPPLPAGLLDSYVQSHSVLLLRPCQPFIPFSVGTRSQCLEGKPGPPGLFPVMGHKGIPAVHVSNP